MIFRRYFSREFYLAVGNHMKLNLSDRDGVICPILNIEIVATLFTGAVIAYKDAFRNASGTRYGTRLERVLERVQNAFFIRLLLSNT